MIMMTKGSRRIAVPKAIRERVLGEFYHRCAICSGDRPQIHHIDEDPANNDVLNLLPLCPNCHLRDQHDPTTPLDYDKLRLFRKYRDPMILDEKFHPLWLRCRFLLDVDNHPLEDLKTRSEELFNFAGALEMGAFYAHALRRLLEPPTHPRVWALHTPNEEFQQWEREDTAEYRKMLNKNQEQALALVVEMLRYQNWSPKGEHAS